MVNYYAGRETKTKGAFNKRESVKAGRKLYGFNETAGRRKEACEISKRKVKE
jgi:hypothetical protein